MPLQGEVKNGHLETYTSEKEPVPLLNEDFAKQDFKDRREGPAAEF